MPAAKEKSSTDGAALVELPARSSSRRSVKREFSYVLRDLSSTTIASQAPVRTTFSCCRKLPAMGIP